MKTLKEIKEEGASLKKQMEELHEKASTEKRDLTAEENQKFDEAWDKYQALVEQEKRSLKMAALKAELKDPVNEDDPNGQTKEEEFEDRSKETKLILRSLASGKGSLSAADQKIMEKVEKRTRKQDVFERRASTDPQSVTRDAGGYLVPTILQNELIKALKLFGGARDMARVIETDGGYPIDFPTIDDTSNKGRLLGINTQVTVNRLTFGKVTAYAFKFSSDEILIPTELLQDEKVDMNAYISDILGERIGRIENDYQTTGSGSSQPQGCVTGATSGAITLLTTAITKANLIDLQYTVDPLYRRSPKCAYMFNDATAKYLYKLSLGTYVDVPLFASQWTMTGNTGGLADKLLGFPYIINQSMDSLGAGNKPILFGDFSRFLVRDVAGIRMLRLTERYADYDQIAIIVLHRMDSRVLTAGALKYATCGTT
jgi:HK97 family phage major capsid protein